MTLQLAQVIIVLFLDIMASGIPFLVIMASGSFRKVQRRKFLYKLKH